MSNPHIPASFIRKKLKILADLSVPDTEYSDKSPKGSVDEGIRELIEEINVHDGLVTTSSCAGRISVFLEGGDAHVRSSDVASASGPGGADGEMVMTRRSASGGKGGGSWLFTSHEALQAGATPLMDLFHLQPKVPGTEAGGPAGHAGSKTRYIRFSFEPMILHVMAASLKHAQPLLSAAINAGFRESGVQSLRNLEDPGACPMVAIRTAGLALESIIGRAKLLRNDTTSLESTDGIMSENVGHEALVDKEYLGMLVDIANQRFEANSHRVGRFRACLSKAMSAEASKIRRAEAWEDAEQRRLRKRQEGLQHVRGGPITSQRAKEFEKANQIDTSTGNGAYGELLFGEIDLKEERVRGGPITSQRAKEFEEANQTDTTPGDSAYGEQLFGEIDPKETTCAARRNSS